MKKDITKVLFNKNQQEKTKFYDSFAEAEKICRYDFMERVVAGYDAYYRYFLGYTVMFLNDIISEF